ncbi:UDP-N-acetylmuramate--alanine ligase [Thiohalorhabdus denitrificans]|uniref:UDP-N-acetylmuramate--L-alanine ligase n=1 Tax=Thiohalorhabdus denitrificans TaxID=381306 RepID=A0A0P9CS45_9GAMM|nr:UDP-N-acetylmuramate--L-alanine ligase [Thiohalorhabdus denitrificans]KPV39499.1 UDP-N-acetylmuramate--alanine ligase [Thiohalorhabdus denitrificans]SCY00628.1 UDP-N-acetylmuramate--L-alanine ligase [Thiohalorhabdus denitrificans]
MPDNRPFEAAERPAGPERHHRIHFVGIGGAGMSGIAEVLLALGFPVSGSDLKESATVAHLRELGARVHIGHDPENVAGVDVVVTSSAVKRTNPEVAAALDAAIPVIPRAEMLAELMRFKRGVAVAGTHGKTTTTSLVATLLHEGGLDPTMVIGGRLNSITGNGMLGEGDYLVAEADESDASFLYLHPQMAVVTGMDPDHMDTYGGDPERLEAAFLQFLQQVPFYGLAVLCRDHPRVREMLPRLTKPWVTYGYDSEAHYQARNVAARGSRMTFECWRYGEEAPLVEVALNLPGRHNIANALAAIAVADRLGVAPEAIRRGLEGFSGVGRRTEVRGERDGILYVDDYGHHPEEVRLTLAAVREAWPERRLVVAFQPHRYTRTRDLLEEFGGAFGEADELLLAEVYPAGEEPIPGAEGPDLHDAVVRHGHPRARFVGPLSGMAEALGETARPGDVVLTLGAGDIGALARELCPGEEAGP